MVRMVFIVGSMVKIVSMVNMVNMVLMVNMVCMVCMVSIVNINISSIVNSRLAFHSNSMYMNIDVPDIKSQCQCWLLRGQLIVINEDNEGHKY